MRKISLQIKSTILALLFLVANNTYAVTFHFCGSHLIDTSYVGKVKTCNGETQDDCSSKISLKKKCCKTITQLFKADLDSYSINPQEFSFIDFEIQSKIIAFPKSFEFLKKQHVYSKDKSPPERYFNYQLLFQTFLI